MPQIIQFLRNYSLFCTTTKFTYFLRKAYLKLRKIVVCVCVSARAPDKCFMYIGYMELVSINIVRLSS